jgi:hypothetical protein
MHIDNKKDGGHVIMTRTNHRSGYYSRYLAYHTRKNYPLLALGVLFLAGALLGALLVRTAAADTLEVLLRLTGAFIERRREQAMLQIFLSSLGMSLAFVAALFLLGFSAISQPVVVLTPFFRGLGAGFSMASFYASHGAQAIGFVAVLLLPGMVLSVAALFVCCRESLRLAGSFFRAMGADRPAKEFYPLRLYVSRYLSAVILSIFSALLEALLYFVFAKSFLIG